MKHCASAIRFFTFLASASVGLTAFNANAQEPGSPTPAANEVTAISVGEVSNNTSSDQKAAEPFVVDVRLGLDWSAAKMQPWIIGLSIADDDAGKFVELENHCDSPDSVRHMRIADDGRSVVFAHSIPASAGKLSVRFQGKSNARLQVQTRSTTPDALPEKSPEKNSVVLTELLLGNPFTLADRRSQSKVVLQRRGDDEVLIRFSNGSMFHESDQPFSIMASANALVKKPAGKATLKYQLYRVGDAKLVDEQQFSLELDSHGNSAAREITGTTPKAAGVYEVRCLVVDDGPAIWSRIRMADQVVAKSQAVLVVNNASEDHGAKESGQAKLQWNPVGEIRPAQKPEWELRQWLPPNPIAGNRDTAPSTTGLAQAKHGGKVVSLLDAQGTYRTRLPRLQSGSPHRISIRYPAGQPLNLRVELSPSERMELDNREFVLTDTPTMGRKHAWQTQSILYYPTDRDAYIRLTNASDEQVISFESISVFVGQEQSQDAPQSSAELSIEKSRTAMLHVNDFYWSKQLASPHGQLRESSAFHPAALAAHQLFAATARLADYLSLSGYNAVSIPGNFQGLATYTTNEWAPHCQQNPFASDCLELVLRSLKERGVQVFVGVDPSVLMSSSYRSSAHDALLQPAVQAKLSRWLNQLDQFCITHKAYAGLVLAMPPAVGVADRDTLPMLSESMLRRFAAETQSAITPDATVAQLRAWAYAEGRSGLRRWCDAQALMACQRVASEVRGKMLLMGGPAAFQAETGQQLVVVKELNGQHPSASALLPAADSNQSPGKSQAVRLVSSNNAIVIGSHQQPGDMVMGGESGSMTGRLAEAVSQFDPQFVIVRDAPLSLQWDDSLSRSLQDFASLPVQEWTRVAAVEMDQDPDGEPKTRVETDTTSEQKALSDAHNLSVLHTNTKTHSFLVVSNLAPWQSIVDVQCNAVLDWQVAQLASLGDRSDIVHRKGSQISLSVPPQTMIVLKAANSTGANPIRTWTSQISGGDQTLAQIKDKVTAVVKRIGTLSQPDRFAALSNGGFEQAGSFEQSGKATIAGWMHTQHPSDAVRIDGAQASEGRHSVVLKNGPETAGRTWIVSEQFNPPASGRLAVSLALRGELVPGDQTKHQVQVSIEGTREGEPIRHSQIIQVDRDGQWQQRRVVLEADQLNIQNVDSIRLTLDSLSSGRLWLDDVQLHDRFPMANERRELQDEAFMAVQGLQRGDLTAASSLLQNHWAQKLLTNGDLHPAAAPTAVDSIPSRGWVAAARSKTIVPSESKPSSVGVPFSAKPVKARLRRGTGQESKPPSVAERIKGWLPRPLRF